MHVHEFKYIICLSLTQSKQSLNLVSASFKYIICLSLTIERQVFLKTIDSILSILAHLNKNYQPENKIFENHYKKIPKKTFGIKNKEL